MLKLKLKLMLMLMLMLDVTRDAKEPGQRHAVLAFESPNSKQLVLA